MPAKSPSSKLFAFLILAAGFLAAGKAAAAPTASGDVLDQKRIHSDYNEGNFERVTTSLEAFMAGNKTYSLEDSIFIAKHLAVVYSANPQTREKGKYFMYRLLALLPSAKLVDMYVSDEIDRIFDKVREEFMTRQKAFGVDSTQMSLPQKSPSNRQADPVAQGKAAKGKDARGKDEKDGKSGIKPVYFIAGGSALIAAVAVSYFMFSDSPQTSEKIYAVP